MKTRKTTWVTKVSTGELCPESGAWKATIYPFMPTLIAKGNKMPPQLDKPVTWELIQKYA